MEFPFIISSTRPFSFKGSLSGIFHFCSNCNRTFRKQTVDIHQTPRFAASDLDLHYLPMSHKSDARLLWVNDV